MLSNTRPPLTDRQRDILEYIAQRCRTGVPPTVREIAQRFGIRSPNGVMSHLRALRSKGYLTWSGYASRTLRLLDPPGLPVLGTITEGGRIHWERSPPLTGHAS